MTSIRIIWLLLSLLWIGLEIILIARSNKHVISETRQKDTTFRMLWLTVIASFIIAFYFKANAWMPLPLEYLNRQYFALTLFCFGIVLRFTAIVYLGNYFSTSLVIIDQHQLMLKGPFRYIRHPTYTGAMIAFAAAGLAMGNILSLITLTFPVYWAFNVRVNREEDLLLKQFGNRYQQYCRKTGKFIPKFW